MKNYPAYKRSKLTAGLGGAPLESTMSLREIFSAQLPAFKEGETAALEAELLERLFKAIAAMVSGDPSRDAEARKIFLHIRDEFIHGAQDQSSRAARVAEIDQLSRKILLALQTARIPHPAP